MSNQSVRSTWLRRGVLALLGMAAIVQLVSLGQQFVAPQAGLHHEPARAAAMPAARAGIDLHGIVAAHLFGEAAPDPAAQDLAQPAVALLLTGVLSIGDGSRGMAIIAGDKDHAQVYRVGDRLPGGAQLRAVYARSALVERAGDQQILYLPRTLSRSLLAALNLPAGEDQLADAGPAVSEAQQQREFENLQRLSALNPSPVINVLNPDPIVIDGTLRGYELTPTRPEKLGLQRGDVLKRVNGLEMTDPTQANLAFSGIVSTHTAVLTILRAGKTLDVTVDAGLLVTEN